MFYSLYNQKAVTQYKSICDKSISMLTVHAASIESVRDAANVIKAECVLFIESVKFDYTKRTKLYVPSYFSLMDNFNIKLYTS